MRLFYFFFHKSSTFNGFEIPVASANIGFSDFSINMNLEFIIPLKSQNPNFLKHVVQMYLYKRLLLSETMNSTILNKYIEFQQIVFYWYGIMDGNNKISCETYSVVSKRMAEMDLLGKPGTSTIYLDFCTPVFLMYSIWVYSLV